MGTLFGWIFLLLNLFATCYAATSNVCIYESSSWAPMTTCSVTCGNGYQNSSRTCCDKINVQNNCVTPLQYFYEIQPCYVAVVGNGGWSNWSSWGACPCGGSSQTRTRTCTNPVPYCNGTDCAGNSTEYQACSSSCCPVNGGWSIWGVWSTCTVTCGGGSQSRSRTCTNPTPSCNGTTCAGNSTESATCNSVCCPVNGSWSNWGSWGACPVTCGGTTNNQVRTRSCTNPATSCGGIDCTFTSGETNTSYTTCNTQCCPVNGAWSTWDSWDTCTVTCGGGSKSSLRTCTNPSPSCNGTTCSGSSTTSTTCNSMCCPVDGAWSSWGVWEACPVTCGGTTNNQIRTRSCTNPATTCGGIDCTISSGETNASYTTCNTECCPVNGGWSAWSALDACPVTCGGGSHYLIRNCTNPSPTCGGTDCPGNSTQYSTCNPMCCPVDGAWSDWGSWEACPVTCGGTINNQIRTRSCTNPATTCGGVDCTISSGETNTSYTTCNANCCPVDGGWSAWSALDTCSVTCGGGSQSLIRNCSNPSPSCGGSDCPENSTQYTTCNSMCCPVDGGWSDWGLWEACPVTCGGAANNQIRTRSCTNPATTCGGINCTSSSSETNTSYTTCNTECCPVDGGWSAWSALDACSVTCGGGSQSWRRICTNPFPSCGGSDCPGTSAQSTSCNSMCCPVDGAWTDWGSWEACPVTCGGTTNNQIRTRSCTNPATYCGGMDCTFSSGETNTSYTTCNTQCCPDTILFFTNLQCEFAMTDEKVSGNIYKVLYYHDVSKDSITWAFTTSNSNISFDIPSEMIYLKAALSIGNYTITFHITDSCGNNADGNLSIKVFNTPPHITSLPSFINLHENVKEGQLLHTLKVNDRQENDTIKCGLTAVTPSSKYFAVYNIYPTPGYGIYLQPNATFDYDTYKIYKLFISCEDGKNPPATGYFFVYIQKNHPPRFLNLPASIDLDASSALNGDLIYTVHMEDDENDTLAYTLTTEPINGPYIINDYGNLLTTSDMSKIYTPAYNLKLAVNDSRTTVGKRTLSVHLTNINDAPVISNLPLLHPFLIEENSHVGTTLYHVRVRDLDIADTEVINADFHPNSGSSYFYLSNDGFLTISSDLDYESIANSTFKVVVNATDGKVTASATLSLIVTDQNEVPVFNQTQYSVEQVESTRMIAFPSAGFNIYDPDASESLTYWLDCGNDTWRFLMNNTTGLISYAYMYDLDKLLIQHFNCIVRVKDKGFNTCSASLIIKIKNINDNPPYFNQTQFAFYATPDSKVGSFIGSVIASDRDIFDHGNFSYQLNMTSNITLFVQLNDTGTLYVKKLFSPEYNYGDVITFELSAIDNGGLQTTVKVWIVFAEYNKTTSTFNTTTIPKTFRLSSKNTLWLTAFVILILSTIVGSLYYLRDNWIKWLTTDCWRLKNKTPTNTRLIGKTHGDVQVDITNNNKREISDVPSIPASPWFQMRKSVGKVNLGKPKRPLRPLKPLRPNSKTSAFAIIKPTTESAIVDNLKTDQIPITERFEI